MKKYKGNLSGRYEAINFEGDLLSKSSNLTIREAIVTDLEPVKGYSKAIKQSEHSHDADTIGDIIVVINDKAQRATFYNAVIEEVQLPNTDKKGFKALETKQAQGDITGMVYGELEFENQILFQEDLSEYEKLKLEKLGIQVPKKPNEKKENPKGGVLYTLNGCFTIGLKLLASAIAILFIFWFIENGFNEDNRQAVVQTSDDDTEVPFDDDDAGGEDTEDGGAGDEDSGDEDGGEDEGGEEDTEEEDDDNGGEEIPPIPIPEENNNKVQIKISDYWADDGDVIDIYLNGSLIENDLKISKSNEYSRFIKLKKGKNKLKITAVDVGPGEIKSATPRIVVKLKGDIKYSHNLDLELNKSKTFILNN